MSSLGDEGIGMDRQTLDKSTSWFFSSARAAPGRIEELLERTPTKDGDTAAPLAGWGFGLPMSRVNAQYWGGDVTVHSVKDSGCDVYIYL